MCGGGVELVTRWAARRYGRLVLAGGLSTFLMLNLTLHAGAGLHYYCSTECLEGVLAAQLGSLDRDVILHIKERWLDPPAPRGAYKPSFPLDQPPWASLGSWGEAYKFINDYFKQYKRPGTFVEVGAGDGEFRSLTLWLEQRLGFRGLLLEPHPEAYVKLRGKTRAAHSVQACATPEEGHRKDFLWIREPNPDLPPLLRRLQEGSNKLLRFVPVEDRDLGRVIPVQCFNLGALVVAALRSLTVDLLVISTLGGEAEVLRGVPGTIRVKMLVVVGSIVTADEMNYVKKEIVKWRLVLVWSREHIHIFAPEDQVA
ncbi:uncharacterized protein LOC126981554 [Eriocheir sinensis]|uniref:uncharacterized protein LOC126981554 n=1 Tax=Eriocheir sinensis TaxID=95602 RepID=UPI0021CA137E|nr:uncharacterized protein LOC126981554 [Eriocheir sinensis]